MELETGTGNDRQSMEMVVIAGNLVHGRQRPFEHAQYNYSLVIARAICTRTTSVPSELAYEKPKYQCKYQKS